MYEDEFGFHDGTTNIKIISVGVAGESIFKRLQALKIKDVEMLSVKNDKNFEMVEEFLEETDLLFVLTQPNDTIATRIAKHMKQLDSPIVVGVLSAKYDDEFAEDFDAFIVDKADSAATQVSDMITLARVEGLVKIDFIEFQTHLSYLDNKNLMVVRGNGATISSAIKNVIESEKYEMKIAKSTGIIFSIFGDSEKLSMSEMREADTLVEEIARQAEIVWGAQIKNITDHNVLVILLAAGF